MKAFLKISQVVFFCAALTGLSSCFVQTLNSVNGDAKAFQPLPANSSAAFTKASGIIQKNCATCHEHTAFAGYSEADYVSNKLVVPNNPSASLLVQMLKGSGVGNGTMPEDAAALSQDDIAAIKSWITSMGTITPTKPTTLFGQSQIVINNSCVGCHKEISGAKESDFVTLGWVVPGNPEASKLYYKMIGANVSGETLGDMPLKGNPVAADDLQTIHQWISGMNPVDFPPTNVPDNSAFGKVQKIIGDNCLKCHKDFGTNSEADFISGGLVTPGSASGSTFYTQLIGSIPTSADSDMPKAGAPLTTQQLQDVADWINALPIPPSPTDLAIGQIRANFEKNIKPLVQRGCMDCHNSKATPDGWLGKVPGARQLEEKHIVEASAIIDFSLTYPAWSAQPQDPVFYLNEIQSALTSGKMPPGDYKIFHENDGGVLKPAETQTVLNWATSSIALLQAADTSKPTASKFFSQKCLGCHNSSTASGGFAFENNSGVITVPSGNAKGGIPFVTQMNPENSAVYLVLLADQTARKGLAQMPYQASSAQQATDADRQLVMDWINTGAK
jgi:mono/diheme cytochrome c family protein